jgi:molybdopterin molybdotransferase
MSVPPIPLAHAWERLLEPAVPLGQESLPTERAVGRYLAEDLVARRTQPAADLSAMDGYAVADEAERGPWQVVGESAAGHPFAGQLQPGQAIRLSTGALMPAGGGAVLLQENASRDGHRLTQNGQGDPSARHIRRRGFDFAEGSRVLPAGCRIGPAHLALALSAGHAALPVHRLADLVVLDSGDELAADPAACLPHQIPASNGAMIAAMAAPFAAQVRRIGPVRDSAEALAAALARCEQADVVVTSGGASVGDHDLVLPALEAWGAEIAFWKVAIRPGKPLLVARRGPQWIIGLPGNPVSSHVTAFLFLLPLLRRLGGAGHDAVLPRSLQASLGEDLPPTGDRQEFVRARLGADGLLRLAGSQDSSALAALANANVLIDRKPVSPATPAGQFVQYYSLDGGGTA